EGSGVSAPISRDRSAPVRYPPNWVPLSVPAPARTARISAVPDRLGMAERPHLSTRLRSSAPRRSEPSPRFQAGGRSAAPPPSAAPAFELLESKLFPPRVRSGTVPREKLITLIEGSRAVPV